MKLSLLFLIIASTTFSRIDLALASSESEQTKTFEFDSVQRYLRVNSAIAQEDEERQLSNEEMKAAFKQFLPKLAGFSYDSIQEFANHHYNRMMLRKIRQKLTDDSIISSLFKAEFLEELRRRNSFRFDTYVDIGLYLVLLETVDGSTLEAAKQIDTKMQRETMEDIASRMERGQFLLWSRVLGAADQVKENIFGESLDTWSANVLERYESFHADEDKRHIPGME